MKVLVSNCCGALPFGESYEGLGLCSICFENADFHQDFYEEEKKPSELVEV